MQQRGCLSIEVVVLGSPETVVPVCSWRRALFLKLLFAEDVTGLGHAAFGDVLPASIVGQPPQIPLPLLQPQPFKVSQLYQGSLSSEVLCAARGLS